MLPEEVTRFIGQGGDLGIFEVEKGAIRRYADAIDDQNPLYWDEEYARNSRYGSIMAPPGFLGWPTGSPSGGFYPETTRELSAAIRKLGYTGGFAGGIDYEFFRPVRAGDKLAVSAVIKDVIEREGKTGKMVFTIRELTYTELNGHLVAKARSLFIQR